MLQDILLEECYPKKWKPIAFLSRTIQPAERNYEIYNKELLAIMEALAKWRQYLLDAMEPFEIWMDHENLKYFREPYKLNGQQARWYLKLQDYDFILQHILEKTNTKADILSRKNQANMKEDNKDVQLLKEKLQTRRTIAEVIMLNRNQTIDNLNLLEEIQRNNIREQDVQQALKKEDRLT